MGKDYVKASIEKADSKDADFRGVASTQIVDRHGEIIDQAGWDLSGFKKNPVLLWSHDHFEPAVGIATKVWVEGTGKKAKLMIEGKIHEATERARAIKYMVQENIIRTMSVGYGLIEAEGNKHTKMELREVSFVNIPANPQALISAYKSLEEQGFKKSTMNELGIPTAVLDSISKLTDDVEELKTSLTKALTPAASPKKVLRNKQSMSKIIARATETLLEADKKNLPKKQKTELIKVIKKANEHISRSHKELLKSGKT